MTDLDQLLADEARRDELAPPVIASLGDAVRHARVSTRRRYSVIAGLALAAVGVTSSSLLYSAAGSAPHGSSDTRLAAYDHVLGPDTEHPGFVLVVGPADEHTAHCTKVRGAHVYYHDGGRSLMVSGGHVYAPAGGQIEVFVPVGFPDHMPPGPYYEFQCPKR